MASELLDCPFQSIVLWNVMGVTCRGVEVGAFDVFRNGHKDVNVVGDRSFLVVALDLHDEPYPGAGGSLNDHIH